MIPPSLQVVCRITAQKALSEGEPFLAKLLGSKPTKFTDQEL